MIIQLITLLSSALIQFGAVGFFPLNVIPYNQSFLDNSVWNPSFSEPLEQYYNDDSVICIYSTQKVYGYDTLRVVVANDNTDSHIDISGFNEDTQSIDITFTDVTIYYFTNSNFVPGISADFTNQNWSTNLAFGSSELGDFQRRVFYWNPVFTPCRYGENLLLWSSKNTEHLPPTDLDPSGKNDKPVNETILDGPDNNNFIQNSLNYISNFLNGIYNKVVEGFNGVFYYLHYYTYVPSADEIVYAFNNSLLGQNLHLFGDVETSFRDNFIITTPDNFVINFSFPFMNKNIPFTMDFNGIFGAVLMSRVRKIITAFIYVSVVFMLIHDIPHTIQGLNGFGGGK